MSFWTSIRNAAEDITGLVTTGGFVNHEGFSNPGKTLGNIKEDVSGAVGGALGGGDPASNIYDPFKQYRGEFGSKLASLQRGDTQFTPQDPSYKFRMDQGMEAVNRGMAAQGQIGSGLQMKALNDYGQQAGSQEYSNEWNRLASLAGVGTQMNVGQTPNAMMQNLGAGLGLFNSMGGMGGLSSLFGGGGSAAAAGGSIESIFGTGAMFGGELGAADLAMMAVAI